MFLEFGPQSKYIIPINIKSLRPLIQFSAYAEVVDRGIRPIFSVGDVIVLYRVLVYVFYVVVKVLLVPNTVLPKPMLPECAAMLSLSSLR